MRKDMNKVLISRPRAGGNTESHKFDKKNTPRYGEKHGSLPKKESMRKKHKVHGDSKVSTDHIKPLERFLISRVGQKWNDVWSEICTVLKGNGLQAQHVKDHVKDYVDGIPHSGKTNFLGYHEPKGYSGIYVDENGVLQHKQNRCKRKVHRYPYKRDGDYEYHKINGCWFRCEVKERIEVKRSYFGKPYEITVYYTGEKRALSSKEAKKLKLNQHFETIAPRLDDPANEKKSRGNQKDRSEA